MGISFNPERSDVNDDGVAHTNVTVGTTAVEIKVGATRSPNREAVCIYNDSNVTIFIGGSNVTTAGATKGIPIFKGQFISFPVGNTGLFAIAATAGNLLTVLELS